MILVAGSANIDFFTPVEHLPVAGETVLGGDYFLAAGGKGANQAVACAKAGGKVAFLGALGQDSFAETLKDSLRQSGVQDWTITAAAPTGAAFIGVAQSGENAITVASGANLRLLPAHLPELSGVQTLVLQLEIPLETVSAFAAQAKAAGVKVVLNAAPARPLPADLLGHLDHLIVNEGELAALGQAGDLAAQLRAVQALGPQVVTVTLGSRGSLTLDSDQLLERPAYPVTVRDTTGAGDTFVGVLVAALSEGRALAEALELASVGAGLACTLSGAQPSMPSHAEIVAAWQESRKA